MAVPNNPGLQFNGFAGVAAYLLGFRAEQTYWPYRQFQIWRVNQRIGQTYNQAYVVDIGQVIEPCYGDIDNFEHLSQSADVGSDALSVDGPMNFYDRNRIIRDTNCKFTAGPYAPTADSGFFAGTIQCDGGTWDCVRKYDNQATTCGGKPASQCGKLGKDCERCYQHIADCNIS